MTSAMSLMELGEIWVYLTGTPLLSLILTLVAYQIGLMFYERADKNPLANPVAIAITHNGTRMESMVLGTRTAQMYRLMPYKAPPDMSRFLLSPMPGLLVDVAVKPGQKVQAGERLAVIEAMKMENVLFAVADGVVGKLLASKGESLAVDQPILEFE